MTDPTYGGSTAGTTGATGAETTESSTTGEVPDATTGEATTGTSTTGETTGAAETCACFSSTAPGEFEILCPAEVKAEIGGSCTNDGCTYDAAAVDAALTFLATGEAGIVTWKVETNLFNAAPPGPLGPRAQASAVDCPFQFCFSGIHVATGDGKIFTQTGMNEDLSTTISPLVGATQRSADHFKECAQDPDVVARFNCVRDAGQAPELGECAQGDELP